MKTQSSYIKYHLTPLSPGVEDSYEKKPFPSGSMVIDGYICCFDVSVVDTRPGENQVGLLISLLTICYFLLDSQSHHSCYLSQVASISLHVNCQSGIVSPYVMLLTSGPLHQAPFVRPHMSGFTSITRIL